MKYKTVSLYVEWTAEADITPVLKLLRRMGAQVREVDEDVDLEYIPGPRIKRAHTVFRVRTDRARPGWELLSAVAGLPGVYSVGEMGMRAWT